MEHYTWAQYFFIFVYVINLSVAAAMHGKPKIAQWNFHVTMVATLISFIVLKSGGFF